MGQVGRKSSKTNFSFQKSPKIHNLENTLLLLNIGGFKKN